MGTNMNDQQAGVREDVELRLEVEGLEQAQLGVRSVELDEGLNRVPVARVEALCDGAMGVCLAICS
jgi:hypothetical protein